MHTYLLKKLLPFTLALLVGGVAFFVVRHERARRAGRTRETAEVSHAVEKAGPRTLPEVHVLSPMLMDEVLEFERRGGGYENPRVISPPGPHYAAATRKDYKQGVLQLNFLFGADGTISEITPLVKPQDCSICLQGVNIAYIDPRDPQSREFVEAAEDAVRRIKFEPGKNGGRSVGMHGLAECIFRLNGDQASKRDG